MRQASVMVVLGFVCTTLCTFTGCGGQPVGKVAGKVTYNGAPVSDGSIIFQSADGTVGLSANLAADGTFVMTSADRPGLPPGDYKVAVSPSKIGSGEAPLAVAPGETTAPPPSVPAQFHRVETSGLTATVKAGDNPPYNFALQD